MQCFKTEEQLDKNNKWYCQKCKEQVQAFKKIDLYRLPNIFILHLKRFKNKNMYMVNPRKINDFIDYPIIGLDVSQYTLAPREISGSSFYDLFAVANHFGGLSDGHYTATCYNSALNRWYYYDDESVNNASKEDIVSNAGYVLFYRRVNL